PNTDFKILGEQGDEVDPKSLMSLVCGHFHDGAEVTVEVTGQLEAMAAEFFKVVWQNLGQLGGIFPGERAEQEAWRAAEEARLARLVDQVFSSIPDTDLEELRTV